MKLKEISKDDRPRERMISLGAEALSSAELLAILLRTGSCKENVVEMSQRIN
jgi:DNA repair protein RadC